MANFCKHCGQPLENGRCPNCGGPEAAPAGPHAGPISGSALVSDLSGELRALFSSGDPFRIAPAAGFALLALMYLLRAFFSLADSGIPHALYLALSWLDIVGLLALGAGAVGLIRGAATGGAALVSGCVSALLGLTGVLNLLSMLIDHYAPFNYLLPCLLLQCLALGLTARDQLLRLCALGGAGALSLVLLVQTFTVLPFLPQLALCWCCLCGVLSAVKSQSQV